MRLLLALILPLLFSSRRPLEEMESDHYCCFSFFSIRSIISFKHSIYHILLFSLSCISDARMNIYIDHTIWNTKCGCIIASDIYAINKINSDVVGYRTRLFGAVRVLFCCILIVFSGNNVSVCNEWIVSGFFFDLFYIWIIVIYTEWNCSFWYCHIFYIME